MASGSRVSPTAQYTMQSGLAAMIASRSLVAATPVVTPSPANSPASLPTLVSDDTQTPVRSKRASLTSCFSARLPQLPVPMSATRIAAAGRAGESVMRISSSNWNRFYL